MSIIHGLRIFSWIKILLGQRGVSRERYLFIGYAFQSGEGQVLLDKLQSREGQSWTLHKLFYPKRVKQQPCITYVTAKKGGNKIVDICLFICWHRQPESYRYVERVVSCDVIFLKEKNQYCPSYWKWIKRGKGGEPLLLVDQLIKYTIW